MLSTIVASLFVIVAISFPIHEIRFLGLCICSQTTVELARYGTIGAPVCGGNFLDLKLGIDRETHLGLAHNMCIAVKKIWAFLRLPSSKLYCLLVP
jgi:hypothetical protein